MDFKEILHEIYIWGDENTTTNLIKIVEVVLEIMEYVSIIDKEK